ncbi:MAG TPA: acyl-CoA dehydrogenase family protein [Polyangiaceae bacterium LLY-WYZ-15_(1-7)]|nr:acyl-CoA dehydrogenase [Sandaracinus sp.]HJL01076.1 acyl-CoA dehydrogenase family protein [Polyangiaceae bacterium LLY-WYZ-15_(1-7)]MBJ75034.1 acyl-CoA dehydrogenase [Sandaracinus sp.]HJL12082.1 acyl-CoA dehydrogenase family protein [Polyangiaceae bacterium LLY-WYZ-15_(1-7)]HJL21597.1 acyl-CoA dehydrogenase family protein [Polyangiaceae bacterium LLY-WYZ-15_(1-7)]
MVQVSPFNQPPPVLGNQFDDDALLRGYLAHTLPPEMLEVITPELREMGDLAVEMARLALADRLNEPVLTHWDAWGERIDHIELTEVWKRAEPLAAEKGLVAAGYEDRFGRFARVHQFALVYLFTPSSDMFSCPLAMTDGAARTLLDSGNEALAERAVPHLTSRDPARFWTSGQWMTESTGGSDVGRSETVAVQDEDGQWRLHGRKWFTSAATSQMALTLARPEGNPDGGHGLALFYVDCRDAEGKLRNIHINRLKDKLGTRKLPTAELALEGTPAELVKGTTAGVRNITPMLNITRTWNAVTSISFMRRGLALARDYADKRVAFGAKLADKPLHVDTLASLQAELEAAFHLTFFVVELLGRLEHDALSERDAQLLRLLTPIAKLTTARQAVATGSEVLESFGGAGYVEDTGLPPLLRDVQVLSIWEGTTNVLALDTLRALAKGAGLEALAAAVHEWTEVEDPALAEAGQHARKAVKAAAEWVGTAMGQGRDPVEAGARRFALTLGRAAELALLVRHAQVALAAGDRRARAAALRFAQTPIDQIAWADPDDAALLAGGGA